MFEHTHLRLTIDVKYDLNGTDVSDLKSILHKIGSIASGEGLLSAYTEAEVVKWEAHVEVMENY